MAEAPAAPVRAAGVVLWRPGPPAGWPGDDLEGPEVALVHRPRYGDWSFPKGKRRPREHLVNTAVRETAEETGVRPVLGRRLRPVHYVADGRPKRVDFWAAQPAAGGRFAPTPEVDGLAWLPLAVARKRLTYPRDVEVLDEFASGPAATTPLVLLRHASAVSKNAWRESGHGDDNPRPLSARGRAQARELSEVLSCYPRALVVSSPAERCLATVRPYLAINATDAEVAPALAAEAAPARRAPGPARALVAGLTAAARPALVCAHRENLPDLLGWACQALQSPVPEGPALRKGEFWVLHHAEGRLVCSEHHRAQAR